MLRTIRDITHSILGRGEASITVPSFDGALKPNQALEGAETLFECAAPEDLATDGEDVFLADGLKLTRIEGGKAVPVREFDKPITALACLPGGALAVALNGREVHVYATPGAAEPEMSFAGADMRSVNALSPDGEGGLIATDGSADCDTDDWAWDLMKRGSSGRALRLDRKTGDVSLMARGLQYAFGAVATENGHAIVSESWRHRLMAVAPDGATRIALAHLPVYPSRMSPGAGGGWWMTAFTARTQLVEFVLREKTYRKRMLAEVAPEYWIVPRLSSGHSFKEPMQGAHLKTMGVVKPWAPPRSYGLVVRLDENVQPVFSLHSRVDGTNHGVVAAVECNGALYMIAKGPRRVLRLPVEGLAEEFMV